MGAFSVVVRSPGGQRGAGVVDQREQCHHVQQLVAQASVEAFEEGILAMKAFWVGLPGAMLSH